MMPLWKIYERDIYVKMVLIAFTEAIEDGNFIYQYDNAPVHTSRYTRRMAGLFLGFESHKKCTPIAGNITPLVNYQTLTSIEKEGYKI